MESKKANIIDFKKFRDKKNERIKNLDEESRQLDLLDIESEMKLLKAFLGLPESLSDIETYEAVLDRIQKLKLKKNILAEKR